MNELALSGNGGALAVVNSLDFFAEYAEASSQKAITGSLLKFSKGDWIADNREIPVNTSFVANMDHLMVGWVRWSNGKPTDHVMGKIVQGYKPVLRSTLGDNDESQWEADASSGKPKDPWQQTVYLVLQEPVGEERKLYTFTTSSVGGRQAVNDLCAAYSNGARMRPAEFPIIALGVGGYLHPDKAIGKVKTPKLTIVGWSPKDQFEAATQADEIEAPAPSGRSARGESYAPAAAVKF